jgi:membrane fusion protein (multidrug efflux system)
MSDATMDDGHPLPGVQATTPRRRRLRPLLFALLPLALVAGAYEYVTGGQVMSTENAYVQAEMVGVSTDVAGIVKTVDVRDNQKVAVGDVLYRLDDQAFVLALARAQAQLGNIGNELMTLKSDYRDMLAQIAQAQNNIAFTNRDFQRQQELANVRWRPRSAWKIRGTPSRWHSKSWRR